MKGPLYERLLLYRVRMKKDPEAFGKIYDLYAGRIYRFVFFKVPSEEEAQDVTADVFLKAWQYLIDESGKDVRYLGALLYSIARNRVIDLYRELAHQSLQPLADEAEETIPDDRRLMEQAEASIDVGLLNAHLRSLKDEYREVLIMRYLDEMSPGEIAGTLGKPAGNVRVLLHRAMNALKKHVGTQADGTTESH